MQSLHSYIAQQIVRSNTRKGFSTLFADYYQEKNNMPTMQPQLEPNREDGPSTLPVPVTSPVDPSTCVARKVDGSKVDGSNADNSPSK